MNIMSNILSLILKIEFKITSWGSDEMRTKMIYKFKPFKRLSANFDLCVSVCSDIDGHLPYFYDVDTILSHLYQNNTLNDLHFAESRRRIAKIDRELTFFISAEYDFQKKSWSSGNFEITDGKWAETNDSEEKYPILEDRLGCLLKYRATVQHIPDINGTP